MFRKLNHIILPLFLLLTLILQGCSAFSSGDGEKLVDTTNTFLLILNPAGKYTVSENTRDDIATTAPLPKTTIDFENKSYEIEEGSVVHSVLISEASIYVYFSDLMGTNPIVESVVLTPEDTTSMSTYSFCNNGDIFTLSANSSRDLVITGRDKLALNNIHGAFSYEHTTKGGRISLQGRLSTTDDIVVAHTEQLYSIHTSGKTNIYRFVVYNNGKKLQGGDENHSWLVHYTRNPIELEAVAD